MKLILRKKGILKWSKIRLYVLNEEESHAIATIVVAHSKSTSSNFNLPN